MANTIPYFEAPKVKPGSLYDKDNRYTDAALEMNEKGYQALRPIFQHYFNQGYSPREIGHILQGMVHDLELEAVL